MRIEKTQDSAGLMLGRRCRLRANIKTTLGDRLVFAGKLFTLLTLFT